MVLEMLVYLPFNFLNVAVSLRIFYWNFVTMKALNYVSENLHTDISYQTGARSTFLASCVYIFKTTNASESAA